MTDAVELHGTPTVRHYRLAERDLAALGVQATTSALDQHVVCQLSDLTYAQVDAMADIWDYQPYATALAEAIRPVRVRAEGIGPWTLTSCGCCMAPECIPICTCGAACDPGPDADCGDWTVTFRPVTPRDYHVAAPYHVMDTYRLAELVTGESVDDLEWRRYRTLNAAITRAQYDPFWPRRPRAGSG